MKNLHVFSRMLLLVVVIISINGCAGETAFLKPRCERPAEPVVPGLGENGSERLACLSDETYEVLAMRDVIRKTYADRLNAVLDEVCEPPPEQ